MENYTTMVHGNAEIMQRVHDSGLFSGKNGRSCVGIWGRLLSMTVGFGERLWRSLKRFWYCLLNSDPVRHCPVYKEQGCAHVDGLLCNFPDCPVFRGFMDRRWVGCAECSFLDVCCSKNYGFGCHDGEKAGAAETIEGEKAGAVGGESGAAENVVGEKSSDVK
jgi:hypothetical protein